MHILWFWLTCVLLYAHEGATEQIKHYSYYYYSYYNNNNNNNNNNNYYYYEYSYY